jgi:hypothetical protein
MALGGQGKWVYAWSDERRALGGPSLWVHVVVCLSCSTGGLSEDPVCYQDLARIAQHVLDLLHQRNSVCPYSNPTIWRLKSPRIWGDLLHPRLLQLLVSPNLLNTLNTSSFKSRPPQPVFNASLQSLSPQSFNSEVLVSYYPLPCSTTTGVLL